MLSVSSISSNLRIPKVSNQIVLMPHGCNIFVKSNNNFLSNHHQLDQLHEVNRFLVAVSQPAQLIISGHSHYYVASVSASFLRLPLYYVCCCLPTSHQQCGMKPANTVCSSHYRGSQLAHRQPTQTHTRTYTQNLHNDQYCLLCTVYKCAHTNDACAHHQHI